MFLLVKHEYLKNTISSIYNMVVIIALEATTGWHYLLIETGLNIYFSSIWALVGKVIYVPKRHVMPGTLDTLWSAYDWLQMNRL